MWIATSPLALLLAATGFSAVKAVDTLVDLGYAKFQGSVTDPDLGVSMWKGIQFAAPPVGKLRFAAPADPVQTGVVNATVHGPICPPQQPTDWTVTGTYSRFTTDEDCLYLAVTAPTNATTSSKLPVVVLIQGGGFGSNSSPNWNGREIASDGQVIVVTFNYRVGMYGFLQARELKAGGGTFNAGIKDMIKALEWVQINIAAFGGNPSQVIIDGVSAGGAAVGLLMAANIPGGKELFAGAISESGPWVTMRNMEQGQDMYDCLVEEKNCTGSSDTLECLRALDQATIRSSKCWFNPNIDGELFSDSLAEMFRQGKYRKVPTIWGTCADDGTKNVDQSVNSTADCRKAFLQDDSTLSNGSLAILQKFYVDVPQPVFPNAGQKWRQLSNAHADYGNNCPIRNLQDYLARDGAATWNYKYDVVDPADAAAGYGAWHTVNTFAFWGRSRDDSAPASYATTNKPAISLTRKYWVSFLRHLDPSKDREAGAAEWTPYTAAGRERILIQTNNTHMERMSDAQALRCDVLMPMSLNLGKPAKDGTVTELNATLAAQIDSMSDDTTLKKRSVRFGKAY
ncbi:uncharacterized protein PgNI_07816 [Pyricularia grisea]|uniref:Carboxylic ester hydrolase n=1 Tax=Pyricularia grisea TaxID=148305 RepID=A0A6P8B270_PYRGI|nr:uncharacterized protein PgNI_07816 [Pyricularia grisea]TLD08894.1 hypothetical protein PgNI_07816 [Pyricularia grisea]